jgi:serine/threonine protein kinase
MIAMQLYQRLKDLHSFGVVHNDIKPDNILVDNQTGSMLYLIDFGLSQYYIESSSQIGAMARHRNRQYLNNFTGNFIFASMNSLNGNSKSRQDDIESAFYMIIFLLN